MHPADFHQSPETTFGDDIFMPKHLTPTTRAVVLALQEAGLTYRQITEKTGFSRATIARLVAAAKMCPAGDVPGRKPGSGFNKRKCTIRIKAIMRRAVEKNPKISAKQLKATNPDLEDIAVRTIQDCLNREMGLPSRICAKKPFTKDRMKQQRLDFAREHLDWTVEDWSRVMFSDEAHFQLCHGNRYQKCRRPRGSDRFLD